LVNFTAALIPASFVSDFLGRVLRRESLTSAGWWMLFFAAVITPFTALAGWLWLRDMGEMHHREMFVHQWLGTTIAVLVPALVFWRWKLHRTRAVPGRLYLSVAALLVAALTVQGHLGGGMSFGGGSDSTEEQGQGVSHPHEHSGHTEKSESGTAHGEWKPYIELKE